MQYACNIILSFELTDSLNRFHSGVGASAIYPMLFTAIDERVRMIGTGRSAT